MKQQANMLYPVGKMLIFFNSINSTFWNKICVFLKHETGITAAHRIYN